VMNACRLSTGTPTGGERHALGERSYADFAGDVSMQDLTPRMGTAGQTISAPPDMKRSMEYSESRRLRF
jgi:hypothetical protein